MFIRSNSWGRADLSWSRVMERLLKAAELKGHEISFISTNGYSGMEYWTEEKSKEIQEKHKDIIYDIDITYTIPMNFPSRFLKSSKVKIGRFDYESSILPKNFAQNINTPDYIVGSSDFVLDIFANAGADLKKLRKIPSGVDLSVFNQNGKKLDLSKLGIGKDTFVFLSIAEPHYRKQLDKLLTMFCEVFTSQDNVALIIKTKFPEKGAPSFEMDIRPHLADLKRKHGKNIPNIKIIPGFVSSLAELYRSAHVFLLPTVGEGWGMPFLEAMASGNIVLAPDYGGQLEFLNKKNSLLCPVEICDALPQEQYGSVDASKLDFLSAKKIPKGQVGRPKEKDFKDLMSYSFQNYDNLKKQFNEEMTRTANKFTWDFAAQEMINIAKGTK